MSATIIGGDGYGSHEDCDPDAAVADLSGPTGDKCWICGEPLDTAPPATKRYYHFSANDYAPGFLLTSPASRGQRSAWDGYHGGRSDVVYIFDSEAMRGMDFDPPWAPKLYEVEPLGPVEPDPEQFGARVTAVTEHSWVTPSARVLRKVDMPIREPLDD